MDHSPSKPRRILYRIVVPFTLLFTLTTAISWLLSSAFVSHHTEETLKRQMEQVAGVISRSGFSLRPEILQHLKHVLNSDLVVYHPDGEPLVTTFTPDTNPHVSSEIIGEAALSPEIPVLYDFRHAGRSYRIVFQPIATTGYGRVILSIWVPTSETDALRHTLIQGLGVIALAGIAAMALIGFLIARTITTPVEELARATRSLGSHGRLEKARIQSRDEIGALAASFNDMVERLTAAEEKLVESERLATAGQMAAGLAHEIRNPLTSIKMLGQVLHGRLKDQPENLEMVSSMVREIDRLDRVVGELVDRTRPGDLRLEWVDLNQTVREVVALAEEDFKSHDIIMEYDLDSELPRVQVDREKIKQVLWNLLLNARDAMPKGGKLVIATRRLDESTVEVRVDDTGCGFGGQDAERCCHPFYTTKPEGMGLGLAISRKIIEKHGGRLTLEERPEGGVSARVILRHRSVANKHGQQDNR